MPRTRYACTRTLRAKGATLLSKTYPTENGRLRIRKARLHDLEGVLQLYAQLFRNTDQAEENTGEVLPAHYAALSEVNQDPNTCLLIAESAGQVVGTLLLMIVPNISHRGRHWALIENVVVDKSAQRANVGRTLMQCAITLARERDCFRIVLSSSVHRAESHKFYERLGFQAYGYSFKMYM
ncbi:MAG: N-acetyltransferase family protein [Halobacteriota archaeon]